VTNHGFADGTATPRQSVLQAGTSVMVDRYGVPRVRCSCGNPLTEPAPVASLATATSDGTFVVVGQPWQQWNPSAVVVVGASSVILDRFDLWDLVNGGTYVVLIGGRAPTTTTTAPPTTLPPPTTTRPPVAPPTTVDPANDDDCRNDPPAGDPTDGYGSGDVGCNPETGEYVCYVGNQTVPCPQN
jgi:hypothetical protein